MLDLFGVTIALDYKLALIVLAAVIGGLIRGFAGFGSALLIVPALTLAYEPRVAVAMEVVLEIPATLCLVPAAIRYADRKTVLPMLLSLLISVPVGTLALIILDPVTMKIVISVAVLLMVVVLAAQREVQQVISRGTALGAATASGLIQGATGVGGPPSVVTLLALGDDARVSRGNVIAFMTGMMFMSLASFWFYGLLTREVIVTGALVSPALLFSVFLGMAGFRRFGNRWLRPVSLAIVAVIALVTLVAAVNDFSAA